MPDFRIFVERNERQTFYKTFEADTQDAAEKAAQFYVDDSTRHLTESDGWQDDGSGSDVEFTVLTGLTEAL